MNIMEGYPETRYQVFTAAGMQTYYESQIDIQESDEEMEKVDAERFNAGLTASLIRKGMEVTVLVAFIPFFDVREDFWLNRLLHSSIIASTVRTCEGVSRRSWDYEEKSVNNNLLW